MSTKLNLSTARVLLIDDNTASAAVISEILMAFGVSALSVCESASDARETLDEKAFDLILCDAEMPNSSGFELVQWIRRSADQERSATAIIMLAGHATLSKVVSARDSGANFLIAKPVTPQILLDRIRWISDDLRSLVHSDTYSGPDRRFKLRFPNPGRRCEDDAELSPERAKVELSQAGIDALFD